MLFTCALVVMVDSAVVVLGEVKSLNGMHVKLWMLFKRGTNKSYVYEFQVVANQIAIGGSYLIHY